MNMNIYSCIYKTKGKEMDKLKLRKFCNEDVQLFKRWLYLPHVAAWYHDPQDWIDEVEKRMNEFSFLHHFIVELEDKPIGFCQFYEYCYSGESWHGNISVDGTYSIDYLIGETEYLRMGYGKAIVSQLIKKIKSQKNAKLIIVQPDLNNKASCNTLLSIGFHFDDVNQLFIMEL